MFVDRWKWLGEKSSMAGVWSTYEWSDLLFYKYNTSCNDWTKCWIFTCRVSVCEENMFSHHGSEADWRVLYSAEVTRTLQVRGCLHYRVPHTFICPDVVSILLFTTVWPLTAVHFSLPPLHNVYLWSVCTDNWLKTNLSSDPLSKFRYQLRSFAFAERVRMSFSFHQRLYKT